jgi:ribosomal protein S18 acetylase RimI-like enzyme
MPFSSSSSSSSSLKELRENFKRTRSNLIQTASFTLSDDKKTIKNLLLPDLKALTIFDRNGLDIILEFTAPSMPSWSTENEEWIFELTKRNMKTLYDESAKKGYQEWKWNDAKKRAEIFSLESRFIIARERIQTLTNTTNIISTISKDTLSTTIPLSSKLTSFTSNTITTIDPVQQSLGRPLAFISFQFVSEGPFEVLYVYELQLEPETQRKGLGKHLMMTVELAARKAGFQAVMLTVLKKNIAAFDFYTQKMKYEIDIDSPSQNDDMNAPYEILSKIVDRKGYAERLKLVHDGIIDEDEE